MSDREKENDGSKTWKLLVGVGLMGLTALSVIGSAAETGSPSCAAKVKDEMAALEKKNGHHASNSVKNNLLAKCSEAEVGVDLEGLFANHSQENKADKEARCQTSVKFAVQNGLEKSKPPNEELVHQCMTLPSEHNPVCGFPADADSYSVVENQRCVSKKTGITDHQVVAKAEKAQRKLDQSTAGESDDGSGGASAQ